MNVSLRWLEAFLRQPLDAADVARRLAMLGAPVDALEPLHAGLGEILVGLVEDVRPHPNADRLRICLVNDGSPTLRNVVCGAANVTAGRKYPYAPVGATVPHGKGGGPMTMTRAKLRGEISEGMLCSARDLALGQDHDGILELDTAAVPGTRLLDAVPLGDHRLVVDVTPNRPDLLGHKGVARELAASYGVPFRLPSIPGLSAVDVPPARRETTAGRVGGVEVRIEDVEGCGRFHVALLRGVRVAPSPAWLRERLEAVGERSINNVVDATNYVMLELNQPMHAYDLRRLQGASPTITVRRAVPGERLVTLDGVTRELDPAMTVIADGESAIGLAGIMGGASSEIGDDTQDVVLEAAYWQPGRIRRARRALGLSTGASYRFERGVDRWAGADAMRRCIEIVLATAGGELADAPLDLWPQPTNPPRIFVRPARVAQLLGVELPVPLLERYLVAIGATVLSKPDDARIAVDVPGWRPDLVREIDLIEEVARLHGYDNFPADLRRFRPGPLPDAPVEAIAASVRRGLVAQGMFEVSSLPLGPADGGAGVRLRNPLSAADSYLRRRMLPGLVRLVEGNWANHVADVRLFEIGTVFEPRPAGERPTEERRVAGVLTGRRAPPHWSEGRGELFDIWDLKGYFEVAVALANPGAQIQVEGSAWVARGADGKLVGEAVTLAADAPPWAAPLFGFELLIDPARRRPPQFAGLPSTPASERVLALLLPAGIAAGQVETLLRRVGGSIVEGVHVESDYRGAGLPAGVRSVAFRIVFRAADRTLRDADVDAIEARMLAALAGELDIRRRDAGVNGEGQG